MSKNILFLGCLHNFPGKQDTPKSERYGLEGEGKRGKRQNVESALSHTLQRIQNASGPILGNESPTESKLMRNILTRWCYCRPVARTK